MNPSQNNLQLSVAHSFKMEGKSSQERKLYRSALSNYRLGKTLGVGAFAKVKLAVHILTGIKVAIKILDRQTLDENETMKGMFHNGNSADKCRTAYRVVYEVLIYCLNLSLYNQKLAKDSCNSSRR